MSESIYSSEPISSYGEPWKLVDSYVDKYNGMKYNSVILTSDDGFIQPSARPRMVACVNFLAGIPTEFLTTPKTTIVSLICEWFRTREDTVMCMVYDEMTAIFDSIKDSTVYVSRKRLLEFVEQIKELIKNRPPIFYAPDIKRQANMLLNRHCIKCDGTGYNYKAGICNVCGGSGERKISQVPFDTLDKEEKT